MPAFTFERLSPPVPRDEAQPAEEKPRGRTVQLLDRFSDARTRRSLRKGRSASADDPKPSK